MRQLIAGDDTLDLLAIRLYFDDGRVIELVDDELTFPVEALPAGKPS